MSNLRDPLSVCSGGEELKPAALGIDLGNFSSKQTLCFRLADNRLQISRVPVVGSFDDEARPSGANSIYEMTSMAGLDQYGNIKVGGQALALDTNFSLKSVAMYRAVRDQRIIRKLPGKEDLLHAKQGRLITSDDMDEMLRSHLRELRSKALDHAAEHSAQVTVLSLTHPSYLGDKEKDSHFNMYMEYVEGIVRSVWGDIEIETVNEGQGTAVYICEDFVDPVHGSKRRFRSEMFKDLDKKSGITFLAVDGGSSSVNVQMQCIGFDEKGKFAHSKSIVMPDLPTGAQGGSDCVNSKIKKIIRRKIKPLIQAGKIRSKPGDLAAYVRDFDEQKRNLNYVDDPDEDLDLVLQGRKPSRRLGMSLTHEETRQAFSAAMADAIEVVKAANNYALDLKSDYAVLFCGGTVVNPGVRSELHEAMARHQEAAHAQQTKVFYGFLGEKEPYWSSAVSAGAALAAMRMPCPVDALLGPADSGWAVGIHVLHRARGRGAWVGEDAAAPLLATGYDKTPWSHAEIPAGQVEARSLKFALVCDPAFEGDARTDRIPVAQPHEVTTSSTETYDLGWAIVGDRLPKGNVRFEARSRIMEALATDGLQSLDPVSAKSRAIMLTLSIYKSNDQGNKSYNPLDVKWRLTLRTDPATKLLHVREAERMPFWCGRCKEEIVQAARLCTTCPDFGLCVRCFVRRDRRVQHPSDHDIVGVEFD